MIRFPDGFYLGAASAAMVWPITPQPLEWGPRFLGEHCRLSMYISENGLSCRDLIFWGGKVHDSLRIVFLT